MPTINPCTNGLLNCSDTIGQVIVGWTNQTTGSLFLTFLFIVILLLAMALMFGIRMEYTAIIILPFLLGLMMVTGDFIAFGVIIFIYLAIILTGNFLLK
jgi:hypothetical protein